MRLIDEVKVNNRGPRTDPCGTQAVSIEGLDREIPTPTF